MRVGVPVEPDECPNCGSEPHEWMWDLSTRHAWGAPVDGQLSGHDIRPILVLACVDCSETLVVLEDDEAAEALNHTELRTGTG